MLIDSIKFKGVEYEFQPPIDVGNHTIYNIGQLATVGTQGPQVSEEIVKFGEAQFHNALETALKVAPDAALILLQEYFPNHKVSIRK